MTRKKLTIIAVSLSAIAAASLLYLSSKSNPSGAQNPESEKNVSVPVTVNDLENHEVHESVQNETTDQKSESVELLSSKEIENNPETKPVGDLFTPPVLSQPVEIPFRYSGNNEIVKQGLSLLEGSDSASRREGATMLTIAAPGEELDELFSHLVVNDPDEFVRLEAANGLRTTDSPEAVDALIRALEDDSIVIQQVVRSTLSMLEASLVKEKLLKIRHSKTGAARDRIDVILIQSLGATAEELVGADTSVPEY